MKVTTYPYFQAWDNDKPNKLACYKIAIKNILNITINEPINFMIKLILFLLLVFDISVAIVELTDPIWAYGIQGWQQLSTTSSDTTP